MKGISHLMKSVVRVAFNASKETVYKGLDAAKKVGTIVDAKAETLANKIDGKK